jgi:hypothetical protein
MEKIENETIVQGTLALPFIVVTLHEEVGPSNFRILATDCCRNVPELPVSNNAYVLTAFLFASTMIGTTLRAAAGRTLDSQDVAISSVGFFSE